MAASGHGDGRADRAEAGEWLGVSGAMLRLGLSERTIRRRVAGGKLPHRKRPDGRLEVWVAGHPDRRLTPATDRRAAENEQLERSIALVERFNLAVHDQVVPVLGQLEAAQRLIADLARENGRLQAKVEELERRLSAAEARPPSPGRGHRD